MKLEVLASDAAVAAAAAALTAEVLNTRPDAALILPAGRSPQPYYGELVRRAVAGQIDFSRAAFFQLDEYLGVDPSDQRSFNAFLRRSFLDQIEHGVDGPQLINGAAPDPDAEIVAHGKRLAGCGGAELAVLGLGRNGHVGFNEPGSEPTSGARTLALHPVTVAAAAREFEGEAAPTRGMTLGIADVLAARQICILVTGGHKAEILRDILTLPASSDRPASLLRGHPNCTVLADTAATSHLDERAGGQVV